MKEKKIAAVVGIFLGLVFIISMFFLIKIYGTSSMKEGSYAKIYQKGRFVKKISMEEETTFIIEGKHGKYNKVQVKDGAIGIVEASCPDFLCGKMGFLSKGPIPITCLPNELVIEIYNEGEGAQNTYNNSNENKEAGVNEQEEIDGVVY
ncbi:MAG: NusG domain II-containing protein [Lachnospiraceae bacterium]|mgnify:CR=1 FL=1|nr:NusG domain II-containing protein [Lachnospiraceae bacterium]